MGQEICYIITTQIENAIPIDVVHFKEKNCVIIPLLMGHSEYETMVSVTSDALTVEEFMNTIIHYTHEYPTKKVFDFISKAELKTFGIAYYGQHFIVPEDSVPILFIDNKKTEIHWENFMNEIHQKLGSELKYYELLKDEEKYRDFYIAETYYFRQLEKNYR
ncbi:hypothetical protein [Ferruginibacter sp. HRS2-29]|uniref:hypothetical protein n=1 Tax=Ferruginibacter sp. HRS2-29 TaxID=2487334 RepID=UPI0020CC1D5A|nr:hypothetical protein [Ferruginibacter sp. HRS2-29]MCP9751876.1 hypothetical protein [Ferruginibacter sp. HRS2-29]